MEFVSEDSNIDANLIDPDHPPAPLALDIGETKIDPPRSNEQVNQENTEKYDIQVDNNRFITTFPVPRTFYGKIIGSRGTTLKQIQKETGALVKMPTPPGTDIRIIGQLRQDVASARDIIEQIIVDDGKERTTLSHFICIPVDDPSVCERFVKFKEEILAGPPSVTGLEETMFQKPYKLHLTFGVMALTDNNAELLATQLLNECQTSIIRPAIEKFGSLDFQITGINHMENDPSKMHVLFGIVESEALQFIADKIVDRFVNAGIIRRERDHVKLHVTLINSKYRKKGDIATSSNNAWKETKRYKKRVPFDGRDILPKYATFDFGQQPVSEVHLSRIKRTISVDGFYEATAIVKVN